MGIMLMNKKWNNTYNKWQHIIKIIIMNSSNKTQMNKKMSQADE